MNRSPRQFHFLVHILNLKNQNLSFAAKYDLHGFQNFLFMHGNKLQLIVLRRYSTEHCDRVQTLPINIFSVRRRKWIKSQFFTEPRKHFSNCKFVIGIPLHNRSSFAIKMDEVGSSVVYSGYSIRLYRTIAKALNFQAIFNGRRVNGSYFNPKLTPTRLAVGEHPIWSNLAIARNVLTHPFVFEKQNILVPAGEAYTPFEKL